MCSRAHQDCLQLVLRERGLVCRKITSGAGRVGGSMGASVGPTTLMSERVPVSAGRSTARPLLRAHTMSGRAIL